MIIPWKDSLDTIKSTVSFFYKRYKRKKKYYKQINKKISKIKLESFQGYRPVYKYFSRGIEQEISDLIKQKKSLLLVGKPLSGKSRILYEVVQCFKIKTNISLLRIREYNYDDFIFPRNIRKKKKTYVVIIDDLQLFVEQPDFNYIFNEFKRRGFLIISSCRSGFEYTNTKNAFIRKMGIFESNFDSNIFNIENISSTEAENISILNNLLCNEVRKRFDGTIGSLFMPLEEMERRFNNCVEEEKLILRDLKKLYLIEAYSEKDTYPLSWIEIKSNEKSLNLQKYKFKHILEQLQTREFLVIERSNLYVDSAYINNVIEFTDNPSEMDIVHEMIEVYEETPKVLYKLGNKIQKIWISDQENTDLLHLAKEQWIKAIPLFNHNKEEVDVAKTLNNLAGIYSKISVIEKDLTQMQMAFDTYDQTLELFTQRKYPRNYYLSIFNKANTYLQRYTITNDLQDLDDALNLFNSILELIPKIEMSILYAQTLQQIGNINLSKSGIETEIDNKIRFCLIAKQYCDDALLIFNKNTHPFFYFHVLYSLGRVYHNLAQYDSEDENCAQALNYYEKSLGFFTEEEFSNIFHSIQTNIERLSSFCNN